MLCIIRCPSSVGLPCLCGTSTLSLLLMTKYFHPFFILACSCCLAFSSALSSLSETPLFSYTQFAIIFILASFYNIVFVLCVKPLICAFSQEFYRCPVFNYKPQSFCKTQALVFYRALDTHTIYVAIFHKLIFFFHLQKDWSCLS